MSRRVTPCIRKNDWRFQGSCEDALVMWGPSTVSCSFLSNGKADFTYLDDLSEDIFRLSLKSLSLSRSKKDQESSQFSLLTLATGPERAAKKGSLPIIEAFFEFGADPDYSVRGYKPIRQRALDLAATAGQSRGIYYMIQHGADSAAVNTALTYAVLAGKAELATRLIVVRHADVDSGVYLQHDNPGCGPLANSGLHSHIEYLDVFSAASNIFDKDERV